MTPSDRVSRLLRDTGGHPSAGDLRAMVEEDRAEVVALLREIEWSGAQGLAYQRCPCCDGMKPIHYDLWREDLKREGLEATANPPRGHAPDCRLAAALARERR